MLIKCPECGRDVSSEAVSCPFCGYPIKQSAEKGEQKQYEKYTEEEIRRFYKDAKEYGSAGTACVVVGLFMFLGGLIAIIVGLVSDEIDVEYLSLIYALGAVIGDIGLIIMCVGGGVNNTKAGNRERIVNDYIERHPDFKEEQ